MLDFKDAVDEFPDYTQMSASRKKVNYIQRSGTKIWGFVILELTSTGSGSVNNAEFGVIALKKCFQNIWTVITFFLRNF